MFFYLSFLKPPPVQSLTHGNILITPQIANDLRTELFDGTENIFLSWHLTEGRSTKPVKLTTWQKAMAYKEIPVPLPPGVRESQVWRLCLSTQTDELPAVNLSDTALGSHHALPVMSMPIRFVSKLNKNTTHAKQDKVERVYQLRPKTEESNGVSLKITEQTSFDLDKKVWDSGIGLSSWLVDLERSNDLNDLEGRLAEVRDALFSTGGKNILELGGGIGIVGLCLAALRSTMDKQPSEGGLDRIITSDLESAMPLIEHNINANAIHLHNTHLEAGVLDWDDEALPAFVQNFPDGFDAIIMADVTYNTASFPSLVRAISSLVQLNKEKPPLLLLGYKERDVAERTLWGLVREIGFDLRRIGQIVGAGGDPVEVWLGVMSQESSC